MKTIVITPKSKKESDFLSDLLKKLKIEASFLSEEEREDLGLQFLMKQADRRRTVTRNTVMKKLLSK